MCWSHWCEYELGEATIFNFIFHLSLVRAYFEEVHSKAIYKKDLFGTKQLQTAHRAGGEVMPT
jgi:hypothetical protein